MFKNVGWLLVSTRGDQIILNHVFKINSGTSQDFMIKIFSR